MTKHSERYIPVHEQIETLLRVLDNAVYRSQLIDRLFPGTTLGYKKEWRRRKDPLLFWSHLDVAHRNRAIDIAIEIAY